MPSATHRLTFAGLLAIALASALPAAHEPPAGIPYPDALLLLNDGNRRFVAGESIHFQQDALRRSETARNGQKPIAAILTCSDSRVPPEMIFDQGIGCLFVVRVAGNVAQIDEVASVEYAVNHLGARLVIVLGHTSCGAVTAVVDDAIAAPNLEKLVKPISTAVAKVRIETPSLDRARLLDASIHANVAQSIADILRLSPSIALAVTRGQVLVLGAIYDLESGTVQYLNNAAMAAPSPAPNEPDEEKTPPPPAAHH